MSKDWRDIHRTIINDFLKYLNSNTNNYILKGGTALMSCYKSDRFSEDIDLDSKDYKSIRKIVEKFCKENGYTFRVSKDTNTVLRFMINYGNEEKPLKVEISFRSAINNLEDSLKIDNINVYEINSLCRKKNQAYQNRDKLRDLYDLVFICKNYWEFLSEEVKKLLVDGFEYKGIEYCDYVLNTQTDDFIDKDQLANDFLEIYDKLGLLISKEELEDLGIEWK